MEQKPWIRDPSWFNPNFYDYFQETKKCMSIYQQGLLLGVQNYIIMKKNLIQIREKNQVKMYSRHRYNQNINRLDCA